MKDMTMDEIRKNEPLARIKIGGEVSLYYAGNDEKGTKIQDDPELVISFDGQEGMVSQLFYMIAEQMIINGIQNQPNGTGPGVGCNGDLAELLRMDIMKFVKFRPLGGGEAQEPFKLQ